MLNSVILQGRLTKDAEMNFLPEKGTPVLEWTVAVERDFKGKQDVDFFRCVWFGDRAKKVADYLVKGKMLNISGRLQARRYETKGQTRNIVEIIVERIHFVDSGGSRSQQSQSNDQKQNKNKNNFENYGKPVEDDDDIPF